MIEADANLNGSIYGKVDAEMKMSIVEDDLRNASAIDMQTSRITQVVH